MKKTLFINIKQLLQIRDNTIEFLSGREMQNLPLIENAFLTIKDGRIADFGPMADCPDSADYQTIDACGRLVLPAWCDSHTHIVFAGNREGEFVDRIHGLSYEEIAAKGGGILNSARVLRETSEEELYRQSLERLHKILRLGTGAIEIKSGYGLTPESELKMLRVIKRLRNETGAPIKATYLAAHALPLAFKDRKQDYLEMMTSEVLPIIAEEKLAEFIDVFCEKNYFSTEETKWVLNRAAEYGLKPKIHVNQFYSIGGVRTGVEAQALSVDHLEVMRPEDYEVLQGTDTMPVALPGCSYFLGIPYTPGREMIDAGLPLALATDYNPGSAPSGNMNFVVASACVKMKLTPEEAINAATINGAYAMGLKDVGRITRGARANLIITERIHSYQSIPYSFGTDVVDAVYIDGQELAYLVVC